MNDMFLINATTNKVIWYIFYLLVFFGEDMSFWQVERQPTTIELFCRSDNSTRKKLPAEPKLTLEKCINIWRANELTTKPFTDDTNNEINAKHTTRHPLWNTRNSQQNTGNPLGNTPVPRNKGSSQGHNTMKPPLIKCKFCMKCHAQKKELHVA